MSDDKKPFTVNDRRHFTAGGEARPEAEESESSAPAAAVPEAPRRAGDDLPAGEPGESLDFIGLLVSLGAQAGALLGLHEPGDPGAPEGHVDLQGARGIIGLIEILERKTEGRRTPEEDQVLSGLLYDLRMAYLARAR